MTSSEGAHQNGKLILFSIAFATFMVNADSYIVNISLPTISSYFKVSTEAVSWVVMSYQLTVTALLLVFGTLGDRIGIKRLFMLGYGVFTLSSLACALSPTLGWLVASRALQGIGASVLYALTPAMVPRYLPPEQRGPAFGALATAAALGISVGTPLGGLITGLLSWHWAFLINIPIGIAAMIVCKRVLPEDPSKEVKGLPPFDYAGSALSAITLVSLIYFFSKFNGMGIGSPVIISSATTFIVALIMLVLWERRTAHPLLDYSLFRSKEFNYGNIANFLCLSYLAGHNFITPFYLITAKKMSSEKAGTVFLIYSLIYMAMGPLAGHLSKRISPRILCTVALILGVIVSFGFSYWLPSEGMLPVYAYFVGLALVMATFIPSNNNVVMGMAPDGKHGSVSGSFRMVGRLGMTMGVCLFQAIFAMAAFHAASMHADALKGVHRDVLLAAFSTVYNAGAVMFAIAAAASMMARSSKK